MGIPLRTALSTDGGVNTAINSGYALESRKYYCSHVERMREIEEAMK